MPDLQSVVTEIAGEMRARTDRGQVATYIPELANVDANQFGLAVIEADGNVAVAGDSGVPFSIQSISKVFTLALAIGKVGDKIWRRVGREPSGSPFNSIVQLEYERGIPRNPFINAIYSRYWAVIFAMGMSRISRFCFLIRCNKKSNGPSKASKKTSNASGGI